MSHCLYRGQARSSFEIRIWKDMQRWFQKEIVRCGFSQAQFCLSQSQRGRLCSQELQEEGTVWIRSREGPPLKPDRLSWEVGIWHLVTKFRYFITVKGVLLTSELNLCVLFRQSPWDFPGRNTEVGIHSLLQGIFLIQGSNPGLCDHKTTYCLIH